MVRTGWRKTLKHQNLYVQLTPITTAVMVMVMATMEVMKKASKRSQLWQRQPQRTLTLSVVAEVMQ